MKHAFLIFAVLGFFHVHGQNFSIPNPSVYITNQTYNDPVHWYSEIVNLTASPIGIQWEIDHVYGPKNWDFELVPPDGVNYNLATTNQGSFTLMANPPVSEKFIIVLYTNGTAANGQVAIKVSETNNPGNQAMLTFYFDIQPGTMGVEGQKNAFLVRQLPNRVEWEKTMAFKLVSLQGRIVAKGTGEFAMTDWLAPGIYVLWIGHDGKTEKHKLYVH